MSETQNLVVKIKPLEGMQSSVAEEYPKTTKQLRNMGFKSHWPPQMTGLSLSMWINNI